MEKTAPVLLEHQFCQQKKSSTGGGVILYSTHAACFFTVGYVIFVSNLLRNVWEESCRERYAENSTRRLNACDCLLQDFKSRCSCFEFQFDLYVGIKQMFFFFCSFFGRHSRKIFAQFQHTNQIEIRNMSSDSESLARDSRMHSIFVSNFLRNVRDNFLPKRYVIDSTRR